MGKVRIMECDHDPLEVGVKCGGCYADLEREVERLSDLIETYRQGVNTEVAHASAEARRDERARCAALCQRIWTSETNIKKQNRLSHGCIASAAAIRAIDGAWSPCPD